MDNGLNPRADSKSRAVIPLGQTVFLSRDVMGVQSIDRVLSTCELEDTIRHADCICLSGSYGLDLEYFGIEGSRLYKTRLSLPFKIELPQWWKVTDCEQIELTMEDYKLEVLAPFVLEFSGEIVATVRAASTSADETENRLSPPPGQRIYWEAETDERRSGAEYQPSSEMSRILTEYDRQADSTAGEPAVKRESAYNEVEFDQVAAIVEHDFDEELDRFFVGGEERSERSGGSREKNRGGRQRSEERHDARSAADFSMDRSKAFAAKLVGYSERDDQEADRALAAMRRQQSRTAADQVEPRSGAGERIDLEELKAKTFARMQELARRDAELELKTVPLSPSVAESAPAESQNNAMSTVEAESAPEAIQGEATAAVEAAEAAETEVVEAEVGEPKVAESTTVKVNTVLDEPVDAGAAAPDWLDQALTEVREAAADSVPEAVRSEAAAAVEAAKAAEVARSEATAAVEADDSVMSVTSATESVEAPLVAPVAVEAAAVEIIEQTEVSAVDETTKEAAQAVSSGAESATVETSYLGSQAAAATASPVISEAESQPADPAADIANPAAYTAAEPVSSVPEPAAAEPVSVAASAEADPTAENEPTAETSAAAADGRTIGTGRRLLANIVMEGTQDSDFWQQIEHGDSGLFSLKFNRVRQDGESVWQKEI